jgi:hypothetical protein
LIQGQRRAIAALRGERGHEDDGNVGLGRELGSGLEIRAVVVADLSRRCNSRASTRPGF